MVELEIISRLAGEVHLARTSQTMKLNLLFEEKLFSTAHIALLNLDILSLVVRMVGNTSLP